MGRSGNDKIYISEGLVTALTIYEVTGETSVVAFNCNNLGNVAKSVREKYPGSKIIIVADNDQWTKGNPGKTKAIEAAKSVEGKVVMPSFQDTSSKPTDFNDLYCLEGSEEVKEQINTCLANETAYEPDI